MNALHGAVEGGRIDTVKVLMEFVQGKDELKLALTMAKNGDDKTAWDISAAAKNRAICQVLKEHGDTNGASSSCTICWNKWNGRKQELVKSLIYDIKMRNKEIMRFAFNFGIFMKEKEFPSSSDSEIIADDPLSCGKKVQLPNIWSTFYDDETHGGLLLHASTTLMLSSILPSFLFYLSIFLFSISHVPPTSHIDPNGII